MLGFVGAIANAFTLRSSSHGPFFDMEGAMFAKVYFFGTVHSAS